MALALCKAFSALSIWKSTTVRAFSSSLIQFKDGDQNNTPNEERSLTDEEKERKARIAEYKKQYYQRIKEDPERMARKRAAWGDWMEKTKNDPERYAEHVSRRREKVALRYKDPFSRDPRALSKQRYRQRKKEEDTAFLEREREVCRAYQREEAMRDFQQVRPKLSSWTSHSWVRQLPWKNHVPIVTQDKIRHICATCGSYRIDGAKIWWRRHTPSDPPLHDCQSCFARIPASQRMPEGNEDITSMEEMKARKDELDTSANQRR